MPMPRNGRSDGRDFIIANIARCGGRLKSHYEPRHQRHGDHEYGQEHEDRAHPCEHQRKSFLNQVVCHVLPHSIFANGRLYWFRLG